MYNVAKTTASIQKVEADYQHKLDNITKQRETMVTPFQKNQIELETAITKYVKDNRAELFTGDSKTLKTPYGTISFKWTGDKIEFESEEVVIRNIKHSFFKYLFNKNYRAAIKVEYRLVKEVVKQMSDKELNVLGIHKSSEEKIYIKPDMNAVKA